jgi:hypothetical protein
MRTLQIRNLPEEVYQALAFRAERAQRSLAQQALVELRGEGRESPQARRRRILEVIRQSLDGGATAALAPLPEALIRDDRER